MLTIAANDSFTPVAKVGTTTQNASIEVGEWSKVGKTVTFTLVVSFTKSGTGNLTIEGLPYVGKNVSNLTQTFVLSEFQGIQVGDPYGSVSVLKAVLDPNTDVLKIEQATYSGSSAIDDTDLDSTVIINITGSYITN